MPLETSRGWRGVRTLPTGPAPSILGSHPHHGGNRSGSGRTSLESETDRLGVRRRTRNQRDLVQTRAGGSTDQSALSMAFEEGMNGPQTTLWAGKSIDLVTRALFEIPGGTGAPDSRPSKTPLFRCVPLGRPFSDNDSIILTCFDLPEGFSRGSFGPPTAPYPLDPGPVGISSPDSESASGRSGEADSDELTPPSRVRGSQIQGRPRNPSGSGPRYFPNQER